MFSFPEMSQQHASIYSTGKGRDLTLIVLDWGKIMRVSGNFAERERDRQTFTN